MNAAGQRRLTPILAALALALGAGVLLLAAGIGSGAHWDAPAVVPPIPPAQAASAIAAGPPLQQFAPIWQKPLFNPDRQPLVGGGATRSSVGDFTLTGVIMTPTLHLALLHDRNGGRELRVHEGEASADGSVTLVEVRPRSAVFDSPLGRVELQLPAGAPTTPGTAEPTGAQAAQGPVMDSRAMAAATPPPGAEGLPGARGARQPTGMQVTGPTGQPPPGIPATVDSARAADHDAAPAGAAERVRAAVQQRRAAPAAAASQGAR